MPIELTTLTKNNSCVYSCSFLNLTISIEINRFFQSYFFFENKGFFIWLGSVKSRENSAIEN